MAGIRLTKAQKAVVSAWMTSVVQNEGLPKAERRAAQEVLDKLEKSELVKGKGVAPGIGWVAAKNAMREVLGHRLATPPQPSPAWLIRMNNRIRDLGLTVEDCKTIARRLLAKNGVQSFERAILYADTILAEAQSQPSQPIKQEAGPLSM